MEEISKKEKKKKKKKKNSVRELKIMIYQLYYLPASIIGIQKQLSEIGLKFL